MPTLPADFIIQRQHGYNLCWLAVAASIADYHAGIAGGQQQCAMAQRLIGSLPAGTICCPATGTPPFVPYDCDKADRVAKAIADVGHYGGESTSLAAYNDIESEILAQNPVALALEYSNGVKHVVAVVDAYRDDQGEVLVIDDPADVSNAPPAASRIQYRYGSRDLGGQHNIKWLRTHYTIP